MTTSPSERESIVPRLVLAMGEHYAERLILAEQTTVQELLVHLAVTGPLQGLN